MTKTNIKITSENTHYKKSMDSVRAVDRALEILLVFTYQKPEMTASELLSRLDLSRPTLYRLLRTLEFKGFVVSSGDPQRFSLGPSVAHLAYVWTSTLDIAKVAQPMLRSLWEETGETVTLMLRKGDVRVCVAEIPSAQPLSFKRGIGHSVHVTIGASGRAIMAFADDGDCYFDIINGKHEQDNYKSLLNQVRQDGFAVSRDELIDGAVAVAVPFFSIDSKVVGSLAVFGPSVRIKQTDVINIAFLLKKKSEVLTNLLGGKGRGVVVRPDLDVQYKLNIKKEANH